MIKPFRFFSMSTLSDVSYSTYSHNLLCPHLLLCPSPTSLFLPLIVCPKSPFKVQLYKHFLRKPFPNICGIHKIPQIHWRTLFYFIIFTCNSYSPHMNLKLIIMLVPYSLYLLPSLQWSAFQGSQGCGENLHVFPVRDPMIYTCILSHNEGCTLPP